MSPGAVFAIGFSMKRVLSCSVFLIGLALLLVPLLTMAENEMWPVLAPDDIPWKFQTNSRIIAIGDIHGDLGALRYNLEQNGVIDSGGDWIAGSDHLVLNGDLVNQGTDSFGVLNFVIELQKRAKVKGGFVHTILGNHEMMLAQGKFNLLSPQDKIYFKNSIPGNSGSEKDQLLRAFTGNSKYAEFFTHLNSIIQINEMIFVHAGLGSWAVQTDFGSVNSTVRAWFSYFQTRYSPDLNPRPSPPLETEWVVHQGANQSPLWTSEMFDDLNDLAEKKERMPVSVLQQILNKFKARYVIVGHIMTRDRRISLNHSLYDKAVIQTDTGNSNYHQGQISALIFENSLPKVWHSDRPQITNSCFKRLQ